MNSQHSNLEARYNAATQTSGKIEAGGFFDDEPVRSSRPGRQNTKRLVVLAKRYKKSIIICLSLILIVAAFGVFWRSGGAGIPGVEAGKYQAVFLVDGTQYVGKLSQIDGGHYKLSGAFFVTANTVPVVSDKGSQQSSTGQVALVKLETGLLNSENEMIIPSDKVLFYENLKPDGQAAKLLDSNK